MVTEVWFSSVYRNVRNAEACTLSCTTAGLFTLIQQEHVVVVGYNSASPCAEFKPQGVSGGTFSGASCRFDVESEGRCRSVVSGQASIIPPEASFPISRFQTGQKKKRREFGLSTHFRSPLPAPDTVATFQFLKLWKTTKQHCGSLFF